VRFIFTFELIREHLNLIRFFVKSDEYLDILTFFLEKTIKTNYFNDFRTTPGRRISVSQLFFVTLIGVGSGKQIAWGLKQTCCPLDQDEL